MNAIATLASQTWVERLGWTLIHFLWQGLLIAVLYAAARRIARAHSANARYLLACVALAAMAAAPLTTWDLMGASAASPVATYHIEDTPPAASTAGSAATAADSPAWVRTAIYQRPAAFLSWVVVFWLAGVIVFWVRLAGGWVVAVRMRSTLVRRAPPEWQEAMASLGARIGISPVQLLVSALVQTPTVVGWLRPVVLAPVGALSGLPADQLEALLLHELAHIRRLDYLVNLLQGAAEALLFYHPAVWWVSGHIRAERELCCDDVAVAASGDALTYARALAQLESLRPAIFHAGVAASGGSLPDRIARLLGETRPSPARTGLGPGVIAVGILLAAAAYGLFGQSDERPAFEVVSIKPTSSAIRNDPHPPTGGGISTGGRLHMTNMPLALLVQFAYAPHDSPHWLPLPASQVAAPAGWMHTETYDLDAKPAVNTDSRRAWLMVQTLLADRFQLTLHRETRELPVYDLVVAKSGLKLPPAKNVGCVSFPPGTPPHSVPGKVDCGYVSGPFGGAGGGLHIQGRKDHMSDLVRELSSVLGDPVLDKTGFTGEFDVDLTFTPDETLQGVEGVWTDSGPPADPSLPNIVVALEQQLGLKLVRTRGPVEILVIEHAERPTPN